MTKLELACAIQAYPLRLGTIRCPCGWPQNACLKMHPDIHAIETGPPEPGATFDGETWRS